MKLSRVYWTLLLISVASSCLLFIIVASEGTHGPLQKHQLSKTKLRDNITVQDVPVDTGGGILDALNNLRDENNEDTIDKTDTLGGNSEEENASPRISESPQTSQNDENRRDNLDWINESLTQQPNLSQGISETGQSVVLTLVDTASAELQNLAEPHLSSEAPSIPSTKNLTVPPSTALDPETTITLSSPGVVRPPSVSTLLLAAEGLNLTDPKATEPTPHEPDQVLVVRADQRPLEDTIQNSGDPPLDHEVAKDPEDPPSTEDSLPASGELEEAARGKLVTGSLEEATAVVLDSVVGSGASEPHEDIPSFSEWTQKRLEEAEKKKTHPNASIQNQPGNPGRNIGSMKVRSKNYASPDCGAKIVAANPEARSARSILVSTRDEYMLNTCTSRVWFVVELCEAIQAKKIELANFELFSSSPKDLSVFVSDRFPTRDWSPVGQFTAKDERDIQSFALHPHLFGKFIKIELHSHYGSEHFCPISLFRAYGTSEFEVLETETEIQEASGRDDEDDDEEVLDNDGGDSSRNLFGSATDVVIGIVKKAAEVLVKTGDPAQSNVTDQESIGENITLLFANCMTPRYTILCNNCTDDKIARVYELLSCRIHQLDSILKIPFVMQTLHDELCSSHGVDISEQSKKKMDGKVSSWNFKNMGSAFASVFSSEYVIALCNVLAIEERKSLAIPSLEDSGKTVNTTSNETNSYKSTKESSASTQTTSACLQDSDGLNCRPTPTVTKRHSVDSAIEEDLNKDVKPPGTIEIIATPEILASQIKPTKTLGKEDLKRESSVPILEPSKDATEETVQAEVVTTPSPLINPTSSLKVLEESPIVTPLDVTTQTTYSQTTNPTSQESTPEATPPKTDEAPKSEYSQVRLEEKDEKLKESEELKLSPQDQLSLDTLLSDLKDLESDSPIPGLASNPATVTYPTASSTPQQKESVFLRLSNRIKALERNMSLSGQYLEELSRRYKKQVEEMQRSLERATAAMGEESRKGEERESRRLEEITALREEVTSLSESLETLLYDHNSWRSKLSTFGQHIIFIFVELVVLVIIISYCRRSTDLDDEFPSKVSVKEVTRRKSAESMSPNSPKAAKKRRPSEIASKITGTYRELMIDDRAESRKERKKKRKRDSLMRLTTSFDSRRDNPKAILPSRRSSSIDCGSYSKVEELQGRRRPDSAPDSYEWSIDRGKDDDEGRINGVPQHRIVVEEIDGLSRSNYIVDGFIERLSSESKDCGDQVLRSPSSRGISILKNRLNSPSFIKTALKSRSLRGDKHINEANSPFLRSDNWEWYSRNSGSSRSDQDSPLGSNNQYIDVIRSDSRNGSSANGHHGVSDDSGSGSNTPTPGKKKKEGGFKKIVKKFF
ncbi:SUN domain-containing ossification factor [Diachasma alloeum]|uniref:SUN domain-containing ossification factor n=1 Tax=Diachasma alloeum TaxID=454923 RepID=UPI0007380FDC|nr:SUN domain-containing ossification factor [Diachasma alloeum]